MKQDDDKGGTKEAEEKDSDNRSNPFENAFGDCRAGIVVKQPADQYAQRPADEEDEKCNRNHMHTPFS